MFRPLTVALFTPPQRHWVPCHHHFQFRRGQRKQGHVEQQEAQAMSPVYRAERQKGRVRRKWHPPKIPDDPVLWTESAPQLALLAAALACQQLHRQLHFLLQR